MYESGAPDDDDEDDDHDDIGEGVVKVVFIDVTCLSTFVDIFDGPRSRAPIGPEKKKFRENSCFFVRKTKVLTNCFFPNSHSATRIVRSAPQYLSVDACTKKKKNSFRGFFFGGIKIIMFWYLSQQIVCFFFFVAYV